MLFNSYVFIFAFLPVVLLGFHLLGRFGRRAIIAWLGGMSLVFYTYWHPPFLIILLCSIAGNYLAAWLIARSGHDSTRARVVLWAAIAVNLAALCYFKYLFPSLAFVSHLVGYQHFWRSVALPLGISFFTFTQIAYLVDLQQGAAELQDPLSYVMFVTFFPHLIAGPILHHKEMVPQWSADRVYRLRVDDMAVGFSWFILGVAKKILLADRFAKTANLAFNAPDWHLGAPAAIRAIIAYTLQLYFDFSGYSDMALGLARMFSIDFPLNFSSPYKARNIIEFWQRWHITLSRYITNYLYSPIQFAISRRRIDQGKKVSRKAQATVEGFTSMVAVPTIVTMFIAGVWHGAGLTYLVFGLLHGAYLTVNHAWRAFRHARNIQPAQTHAGRMAGHACGVLLTFACVLVAHTFFRANNLQQAGGLLASAIGVNGMGVLLPTETIHRFNISVAALAFGLFVVWAMPNTQQILSRFRPSLESTTWDLEAPPKYLFWRPTLAWAAGMAILFVTVLTSLQDPSSFLYFQF